jgi:NAD(P)-dependent dehydrogenase (short-subunit alcohol dehydrogenase family)
MKASIKPHQGSRALVAGVGQLTGQVIALDLVERGARVIASELKPSQGIERKIAAATDARQTGYDLGK